MKKKTKFIIGAIAVAGIAAAIVIPKHPLYYLDYEIKDGYAVITDCKDNVKKVDIPEKIKGYPVQEVGEYAFSNCQAEIINIPDTIMRLNVFAFKNCMNLTSVTLPDSVKYISLGVFKDCDSVKFVKLPDEITEMEQELFTGCCSLEEIVLPKNIEAIPWYTFEDCKELKKVEIPENVREIGLYAFRNCDSLEEIVFPENLEIIEFGGFYVVQCQ